MLSCAEKSLLEQLRETTEPNALEVSGREDEVEDREVLGDRGVHAFVEDLELLRDGVIDA